MNGSVSNRYLCAICKSHRCFDILFVLRCLSIHLSSLIVCECVCILMSVFYALPEQIRKKKFCAAPSTKPEPIAWIISSQRNHNFCLFCTAIPQKCRGRKVKFTKNINKRTHFLIWNVSGFFFVLFPLFRQCVEFPYLIFANGHHKFHRRPPISLCLMRFIAKIKCACASMSEEKTYDDTATNECNEQKSCHTDFGLISLFLKFSCCSYHNWDHVKMD